MANLKKPKSVERGGGVETLDPTPDANRDPITGEPGSHPVGTGIGSAGGAATGAAIGGAVGGPVGAVVGGTVGAVAGGAAGHAAGEALDPTVEDAYWRENYKRRPYYTSGYEYDYYRPAYQYGWENAASATYRGREFDEVEGDLARGWKHSGRRWRDVKVAVRDSWDRVRGRR
jgi:hypothetical protein